MQKNIIKQTKLYAEKSLTEKMTSAFDTHTRIHENEILIYVYS